MSVGNGLKAQDLYLKNDMQTLFLPLLQSEGYICPCFYSVVLGLFGNCGIFSPCESQELVVSQFISEEVSRLAVISSVLIETVLNILHPVRTQNTKCCQRQYDEYNVRLR